MSLRIECGKGLSAVHDGRLDGVPCLAIASNGAGEVGKPVLCGEMPDSIELVCVTFTNAESVDVWIKHLGEVKKMLNGEKPIQTLDEALKRVERVLATMKFHKKGK